MVVLETDAATARDIARTNIARYLDLPNYTNNLRSLGFTDEDLTPPEPIASSTRSSGGVTSGDRARVQAHLDAGADHVCVQVLLADPAAFPRAEWRALAPALIS